MSDTDTKFKHSKKRNIMAKHLRDQGDYKGAYAIKIIDPRKEEYKRKHMRVSDIVNDENEY
jgi:hypothetical protein